MWGKQIRASSPLLSDRAWIMCMNSLVRRTERPNLNKVRALYAGDCFPSVEIMKKLTSSAGYRSGVGKTYLDPQAMISSACALAGIFT